MASHGDLVYKVKALQKTNPEAKQEWIAYTGKLAGGKRDPAVHNAEFLQNFLVMYESGQWPSLQASGCGAGAYELVDQIKALQRTNDDAKQQWIAYTNKMGNGKQDPKVHEGDFIQTFLNMYEAGERVVDDTEDPVQKIKNLQRSNPDAKRQWITYTCEYGNGKQDPHKQDPSFIQDFLNMWESGERVQPADTSHLDPVSRVKALQRSNPDCKQAWIAYTNEYGNGRQDPKVHDGSFIDGFIEKFNSGQAPVPEPTDNTELVEQIKALQKRDPDGKEAWIAYTAKHGNKVRDPSKHDAAFIQKFLDRYQGTEGKGKGKGKGKEMIMKKMAMMEKMMTKMMEVFAEDDADFGYGPSGGSSPQNMRRMMNMMGGASMAMGGMMGGGGGGGGMPDMMNMMSMMGGPSTMKGKGGPYGKAKGKGKKGKSMAGGASNNMSMLMVGGLGDETFNEELQQYFNETVGGCMGVEIQGGGFAMAGFETEDHRNFAYAELNGAMFGTSILQLELV